MHTHGHELFTISNKVQVSSDEVTRDSDDTQIMMQIRTSGEGFSSMVGDEESAHISLHETTEVFPGRILDTSQMVWKVVPLMRMYKPSQIGGIWSTGS